MHEKTGWEFPPNSWCNGRKRKMHQETQIEYTGKAERKTLGAHWGTDLPIQETSGKAQVERKPAAWNVGENIRKIRGLNARS